jgi:hypothetical protein
LGIRDHCRCRDRDHWPSDAGRKRDEVDFAFGSQPVHTDSLAWPPVPDHHHRTSSSELVLGREAAAWVDDHSMVLDVVVVADEGEDDVGMLVVADADVDADADWGKIDVVDVLVLVAGPFEVGHSGSSESFHVTSPP